MDKEDYLRYYREYSSSIVNFAYKMTGDYEIAEEISQDVFIKLHENFDNLKDDEHRRYWLFKVAKNSCLNYIKRKKREQGIFKIFYKKNEKENRDELVDNELVNKVKKALEQLPEKTRTPLLLKEYSDMSYKEIAQMLFTTESNIKVIIFRAKKKLFEILKEDIGDD